MTEEDRSDVEKTQGGTQAGSLSLSYLTGQPQGEPDGWGALVHTQKSPS